MDWPTVRQKILEVIAACVRIDTCWRDREQNAIRLNAGFESDTLCKLHISGTRSNGRDDFNRELNVGTNKLDVSQSGNRIFTLSVLCESFDQGDEKTALNYTERVRSCLQRPRVLAMLREANITVAGVGTSVDVSYTWDDRIVSAANVDVTIAATINENSVSDGPGLESDDWIETVEGHRTDPDVPAPIDAEITHEV